jgi:aminopeptidase N
MYFRSVNMGYREEDEQLFTQGEDIEARHWFPTHDFPNEKFTSEVICHVPEKMTALSNGKLLDEKVENGKRTVRYLQDKPHTAYLICIVAGRMKSIKDQYKDISLGFYTPETDIDIAKNSFKGTKEMMGFFEEEIGVAYPWARYDQAVVRDFMWGGMENTTLTTLTDGTLYPDETENIRSSQGLVAHELAHQWFGDLVTTKDWAHLWLNEGFATYYAALYAKHAEGIDEFRYGERVYWEEFG